MEPLPEYSRLDELGRLRLRRKFKKEHFAECVRAKDADGRMLGYVVKSSFHNLVLDPSGTREKAWNYFFAKVQLQVLLAKYTCFYCKKEVSYYDFDFKEELCRDCSEEYKAGLEKKPVREASGCEACSGNPCQC